MPINKRYIPAGNVEFNIWQANFVNRVVTNAVAWGITAAWYFLVDNGPAYRPVGAGSCFFHCSISRRISPAPLASSPNLIDISPSLIASAYFPKEP